jgi:prevent-host-death family protein
MDRVGVRELRQHASRYLARVERGESIEITDRGRLVARLVPAGSDAWSDLVASGLVTVPDEGVDLLDHIPAALPDGSETMSEVLGRLRADER